jgi:hypothetical protein
MFGWPLVCIGLFVRLPTEKAVIWSLLGGYMLLPSGLDFDVPILPPMDKMAITGIATLLLCWMKGTPVPRPRNAVLLFLLAFGFVIAPIFTSFDNSYELPKVGESVHGFYLSDGLKFAGRNLMALIPLFIAWRFLSTDNARSLLLRALPSATLLYSLPMLFEVRMSPQLHRWVYGYFPNDSFVQQIRADGFRPVVFFSHGLALALFTSVALLAALIIMRSGTRIFRVPASAAAAYLGGVLILCKSLAPALYGVVFAPVIMFTRPRFWVQIGCVVSLIICAYPLLRSYGLAPTQLVEDLAQAVSKDRSASFQMRVLNEGQLLAKAYQKPWFGWGGWGRSRIYDRWTGQDISVTDGGWIIYFGVYGWLGYLSLFGLFAAAMFQARRAVDKEVTPANLTRGGLTLLLTVYLIDAIPNALQEPIAFLLAGCIASVPQVRSFSRSRRPFRSPQVRREELAPAGQAVS